MTPLEIAAKAYIESGLGYDWKKMRDRDKEVCIRDMRAALMALADALETEPDSDACLVKLRAIAATNSEETEWKNE